MARLSMWFGMSKQFFKGESVDLIEMLSVREERVAIQKKLLADEPEAILVSMTMNIPGPIKNNQELTDVFLAVVAAVKKELGNSLIQPPVYRNLKTGAEYYCLVQTAPDLVKKQLIKIEQTHPYGRLLDLDVLFLEGAQLRTVSRTELGYSPRQCFICQEGAKVCGRQRTHSVAEMHQAIHQLIQKGQTQ